MSRIIREIREVWRPLDPARDCGLPDTGVREAELRRIFGASLDGALPVDLPPRVGRLRRTVFAAAGAVVVGGVLVVANPAQGPAFAATPAPLVANGAGNSAAPALQAILGRTSTLAPEVRGDIDWQFMQAWSLNAAFSKEHKSAVVPEEREITRHRDGSATVTTTYGEPVVEVGGVKERVATWWDLRTDEPQTKSYGPGAFPSPFPVTERPPTDPAKLRSWLLGGDTVNRDDAEVVTAIRDLAGERVLVRDERAAVLKVLSGMKALRHYGQVTDRVKRPGDAFTLESDFFGLPTRFTIIVDSGTGAILSTEETLIKDAGKLDVKIPAVTNYQTFAVPDGD